MNFFPMLFHLLALSIALATGSQLIAQDTLFLNSDWENIPSRTNANYYRFVKKGKADTSSAVVKTYFMNGQLESEIEYENYLQKTHHGSYKEWYEDGQLERELSYYHDKLNGPLKTYWPDGTLKRSDEFADGLFLNGKVYDRTGKEATYCMYQEMPQFPGGTRAMVEYIQKTVKYPKKARRKGIQGRVYIRFVVKGDGTLDKVEIIQGVSPELDAEALRTVKSMPTWTPGKQEGELVNVYFNLPINFILRD